MIGENDPRRNTLRARPIRVSVALFALGILPGPDASAADAPFPVRTVERRFDVTPVPEAAPQSNTLRRIRIEHRDERGRLQRWEERGPNGEPQIVWVGVFLTSDGPVDRAAYWNGDEAVPFPELFVTSADGRMQDVLYGSVTEKPRRQIRQYLDAAGREVYQEYFGPRSQRRYSEEFYVYDDAGNELGRTWRRLDGTAERVTRFEILARNEYGHWTKRRVEIDGAIDAVDERTLTYGRVLAPAPAASAGPVPSRTEILPIPFAPGVIAARGTGENALSFTPDGATVLFTRYADDWTRQRGRIAERRNGLWQEPEPVPFAETIYNAALRRDGGAIIYCTRGDDTGGRVFVVQRTDDGWSGPIDCTDRFGLTGSYFSWLADGTLYFHRDGDLHRCVLDNEGARDLEQLPAPINTADGVEFGAWIEPGERRLLFTRGAAEGAPAEASGVFVTFRSDDGWSAPARLPIPYGWSAVLSPDGEDLVYVVDDDIVRVPIALLGSRLSTGRAE